MNCNCAERIKAELPGIEPSAGHDWIDEVLGLLRVTRGQRDDNEREILRLKEELKTARRAQPRRYA